MNSKFYKIIFFFFLLICETFNAQNVQIDSLKRVVENTKIDTVKVNQYNKIADLYKEVNPDLTFSYAQKAIVISLKKEYHFGFATAYVNKGNASCNLLSKKKRSEQERF